LKVNRVVLILLVTAALSATVFAQESGPFVSKEGRFSIALPAENNGVKPLAVDSPLGQLSGNAYEWKIKEGTYTVGFVDAPNSIEDAENSGRIFGSIRERMSAWATSKNGKVLSDKPVEIEKHPGLELKLDFPNALLWQRFYVVSNRLYQVILVLKADQRPGEAVAVKVLDSFKLLSEAKAPAAPPLLNGATATNSSKLSAASLNGSGRMRFGAGETISFLPLLSKHRLPS
jgi:hypothetical protein